MDSDTIYIYRLIDPLTNETRYIGQTSEPRKRLRAHLYGEESCPNKREWIEELKAQGHRPTMEVFTTCERWRGTSYVIVEALAIDAHVRCGTRLLNAERVQVRYGAYLRRETINLRYLQHVRPSRVTHSAACRPIVDRAPGFAPQVIEAANANLTSRYRGVSRSTSSPNKWVAQITVNKRTLNLGFFDDEEAAARAFDRAARLHRGDKARLNFPQAA